MQILVEIPDNQVAFGLKVLESLSFVQDTKLFSQSAIDLWEDLKGASSEVAAHKSGKLKLKTADDLLNIYKYPPSKKGTAFQQSLTIFKCIDCLLH